MHTEPYRELLAEIPLLGGRLTPGIVRVGNTVRRFPKANGHVLPLCNLWLDDLDLRLVIAILGSQQEHMPDSWILVL